MWSVHMLGDSIKRTDVRRQDVVCAYVRRHCDTCRCEETCVLYVKVTGERGASFEAFQEQQNARSSLETHSSSLACFLTAGMCFWVMTAELCSLSIRLHLTHRSSRRFRFSSYFYSAVLVCLSCFPYLNPSDLQVISFTFVICFHSTGK
jgi:hypothetical protein